MVERAVGRAWVSLPEACAPRVLADWGYFPSPHTELAGQLAHPFSATDCIKHVPLRDMGHQPVHRGHPLRGRERAVTQAGAVAGHPTQPTSGFPVWVTVA